MDFQFNLVDEPWLTCVRDDGTPVALGLYDALAEAHTLREMHGETPLGTAALHRLLLAVLHRNFGPKSRRDWSDLWHSGRWDKDVLRGYFDRWQARFDLFDASYPFYQSPDPPGEPEPLNRLSLPHAYNSTVFEHQLADGSLSIPAARAAEWLVTLQAYSIGTGPPFDPYPAGPLQNTMIVMPQGRTLFQTLMFNFVGYHDDRPMPAPAGRDDRPIWECDESPFPRGPRVFYLPGYLEYLTWLNRTVRLLPIWKGGEVRVKECYLSQGARWDAANIQDPMKVYVTAKKKDVGMLPVRLREDKAMWRDAGALFGLHDEGVQPPLAFHWLARHVEAGDLNASQVYDYAAMGLRNDNARLDFIRHERMPLPLSYLADETLAENLREGLKAAEDVGSALRQAGWAMAQWLVSPSDRRGAHTNDTRLAFSRLGLEGRYWSRLELPFRSFIRDLPEDRQASTSSWTVTLQRTARDAFNEAADAASDPLRALKASTLARGTLELLMARAIRAE